MKIPFISSKQQVAVEQKANPVGASLMVGSMVNFTQWADRKQYVVEGYQLNPMVYLCVNTIAQAIAGLHIELKRGDEYVEEHPVLELLRRPNPMMGGRELILALFIDYLTTGEMACAQPIGQKQPAELWPVISGDIEVVPGRGGVPQSYIHKRGGVNTTFPVKGTIVNPRADLFFWRRFNPTDYWRGQSPLAAGGLSVDTHNAGGKWNYSLLRNNAKPSGVISFKEGVTVEANTVARIKEWFKSAFQGAENVGEIPILTGGAEWSQTSMTPTDMDHQQTMKEMGKLIANVYGIPLPMVDNDASTFNNMEMAKEKFYIDTVIPMAEDFLNSFGAWLLPAFEEGLELCIDMDAIPALEALRNRKFERILKALNAGLITMEEARDEIGYDPLDMDSLSPEEQELMVYGLRGKPPVKPEDMQDDQKPKPKPIAKPVAKKAVLL